MHNRHPAPATPCHQSGAVLIVSLLILLVMTLLGVTAMSNTVMEERMAGHLRDKQRSLQAADSALRSAEQWLSDQVSEPLLCQGLAAGCAGYIAGLVGDPSTRPPDWWPSNGVELGSSGSQELSGLAADPHYVIELDSRIPDSLVIGFGRQTGRNYYRNSARGVGGTPAAQSVVQSSYVKRFD